MHAKLYVSAYRQVSKLTVAGLFTGGKAYNVHQYDHMYKKLDSRHCRDKWIEGGVYETVQHYESNNVR